MLKKVAKRAEVNSENYSGPELRGLGWDPLIQNSHPQAVCVFKNFSEELTASIAQHFQLRVERHGQVQTLSTASNEPGQHKKGMLTLLVASCLMHEKETSGTCVITTRHNLHEEIEKATKLKNQYEDEVGRLMQNLSTGIHLGQAGQILLTDLNLLNVKEQSEVRKLEASELALLRKHLLGLVSSVQGEKKTGTM